MAWYDNYTPLVGDTYKGPVSDRYTGPTTVDWGGPAYNAPNTFDYYYYEPTPVQYEAPVIQYTPPKIDYSPQIANIADKFQSQLQNIQKGVILPASQLAPYINQTPLVGQTRIDIKPLTGVEQKDIIRNWAENQISILEMIGTPEATMLKTQKELNDLVELSIGAMSFVGDVYDNLKTTIDTHVDIPQFKLTPLASHAVTAAMEELKWRQNKVDLNSILPKMEKTVQKQLIAEDTLKRNEEYLKTHDQMKTNLYSAAKTYYNADAEVLKEMFASDRATAQTRDIERVQFYFNPSNADKVKEYERRTGNDYISGNIEDALYRYDMNIAKTDTGITQQAVLGERQRGVTDAISAEEKKSEEQSQRMKQQQLDAANTRNALKKAALELETAKNAAKMPMQVKVGDNITLDFNKGTMLVGDTKLLMNRKETPVTSKQMGSYTSLIKNWADNEDNATLKTIATAVYDLTATDKQKLINGGYATSNIVTSAKDVENKEWSMLDGLYMLGKALKSETSHQLFGTERVSATEMWAGQTKVELNSKGKELANTLGTQWAANGKQTNNLGLSDTAVKQFVMENAKSNVIADIAINRPKDVAIMATNALTRSSVNQALSQSDISAILAANPLTDADRNQMLKDQAYQIGAVVTDFDVTGTPVDLVIGVAGLLTGGFIGEADLAAKGIKLVKASKTAGEVSDLLKYAKTASVLAKDSDLMNTAILKATKASNMAVVTKPPGTIARGVTSNSVDIKKASSIDITAVKAPLADKATAVKVKEFNADVQRAAAQPNVAAPSILTKTQTPGTSKTTNAQKLMDNIANGDALTIKAALVENIATDPSSLYKAMTTAAVKSEPATVTKAFQRLEEANGIYVKAANDLVKDVVDSGQGATRLAELSNSLGDAPVIKMLDTVMGMGETGARIEPTPLINEITNIRREWETLRKIESTPTSATPTGARPVAQQAYDVENVMPDIVRDRMNRYLSGAKTGKQINRIEDIASLSDGEIEQVAKKYSDVQTSTNVKLEQELRNYREKASQILGKEGTAQEDVYETAFQKRETTQSSWSLGLKDRKLDDEYKALYSANNLQSVVPEKKGDIGKLQTAAQRTIGRPLDTMDDFKSLTNDEIKKLSENVPSVKHGDIVGYRIQATKEMDKLSPARQTYDALGTKDYTDLVKLQQQRASDLASTADEFTKLARKQGRMADEEQQLGKLSAKIEEQRSMLQSTTEAIDARKLQMGQQKTKQLTAADIKPGVKDRKTAALNAIDAAKKGDYETAIKKFAEARTHDGRSVLSKVDAKNYDGMSIQRINRMEDAVPADQMSKGMKEMLEQMRKERRDFSINQLATKGDDFKRVAFKIKNGDELDELERLKLWNSGDEIRTLAKDALDDVGGNKLVKGLVDDAAKKGDATRAKNLKTSMKEELEKCIKRGECGGGAAAAATVQIGKTLSAAGGSMVGLGILTAAGLSIGVVNNADGKTWIKDKETNTFYEIQPKQQRKGYKENTKISSIEQRISDLLSKQGFYDKIGTEGSVPDIQGSTIDTDEYMCQNFAIDAANAINAKFEEEGIVAKVVAVYGHYDDDMGTLNHALIILENRNNVMNSYVDPISGKTVNLYEQRFMEPQTGYLGDYSGWDLSGSKMEAGVRTYTVETLQSMENAYQRIGTAWKPEFAVPVGDKTLYQASDGDTPMIDALVEKDTQRFNETVGRLDRIDPWGTTTSGTSKVV